MQEKQSAAEATYVQAVEATAAQLASAQQQAVPAEKPSQQLNGIEASHKGPAAIPPTVAGTLSTTVPRGQVPQEFYGRRRSGCLWVSLAVGVGLILFLVIGAGTFCTAVRGIISAAFPEVEVGETVRETIRIAVPDDIDQVILDITFHGGQLFLAPGAEGALVEGTATYNVDQLKPQVTTSGNGIRLEQQGNIGLSGFTTADIENKWDLKLASVPMALKINTGGAEGDIDLGGLSLVDLEVTQGAASFDLRFSEPNQVDMAALKFTAGAARVHLEGLANARAEEIIFEGGAGDYMLEFSGELRDDLEVSIDGGFSTVSIVVPEQVAARVAVEGERNNVSARGVWQETDNEYVISGDGPKITIDVALDSGNLTLRNP